MAIIPKTINLDSFPRGRGPRSSCPALNEEVLLADNKWISAKNLKIGDEVATHLGSNKVTHIDVLKDRVKKEVVFSDNDKEESIITSDSHPYYVQNEEGFVEVKDLKVGDQVGNFKVKEIKDADKGSVVHISIDEAQTYYLKAGDKKVLSHNKRIRPNRPPKGPRPPRGGMPMPFGPRPFDPRFDPPGNQPRPIFPRKPKIKRDKKRGGLFGLRNLIRRLKEQRDMGMPRMPRIDDGRMRAMPIRNEDGTMKSARLQMPQPIPRAEIDISALERLPMGDMPMTQDLPEVAPIGMMPQMRMGGMQDMEPRMMMQEGEDVSLERELFSLQAQLKNLEEQLRMDRSYNDDQAVIETSAKMAAIQKRMQQLQKQKSGLTAAGGIGNAEPYIDNRSPQMLALVEQARNAETPEEVQEIFKLMDQLREMEGRPQLAGGGDFPDLTGDGKVTQADILKGRGVYAEGDEVMMMEETEMMTPSGDEIEASLMEVQGMQPEMQALDQYVQMVIEMVQAGASEAEVIESLRQAGLDDEDIEALFQAVMETLQSNMEQGGIDAELAQLS